MCDTSCNSVNIFQHNTIFYTYNIIGYFSDAAGAPDPITGDGLALAFSSVAVAADAIVSGEARTYQQVRLARGRSSARLGRLLMRVGRSLGRPQMRRVVAGRPSLIPTLVDVAVGRRSMNAATVFRALL